VTDHHQTNHIDLELTGRFGVMQQHMSFAVQPAMSKQQQA